MRGAVGGAVPDAIHVVSARNAALATMCIGPLLIGTPQSIWLASAPTRWASACAVPATSHSRKRSLSGWRAAYEFRMLATSVSVWMSSTGAAWSVRKMLGVPLIEPAMSAYLPGRDERKPDRAAAVHEETVERVRERLHAVVVGDERERRLRLARGEQPLRLRATQARAGAERARDLRVDVEREAVAGMFERAVARRDRSP